MNRSVLRFPILYKLPNFSLFSGQNSISNEFKPLQASTFNLRIDKENVVRFLYN